MDTNEEIIEEPIYSSFRRRALGFIIDFVVWVCVFAALSLLFFSVLTFPLAYFPAEILFLGISLFSTEGSIGE